MAIQWKRRLAAGLVLAVLPLIMTAGSLHFHCEEARAAQVIKEEKGAYGCLTWPLNLNAVRSEGGDFQRDPQRPASGYSDSQCDLQEYPGIHE